MSGSGGAADHGDVSDGEAPPTQHEPSPASPGGLSSGSVGMVETVAKVRCYSWGGMSWSSVGGGSGSV